MEDLSAIHPLLIQMVEPVLSILIQWIRIVQLIGTCLPKNVQWIVNYNASQCAVDQSPSKLQKMLGVINKLPSKIMSGACKEEERFLLP